METRNNIACEKIQELLLDRTPAELDETIKRHLEVCEKCRKFQKTITAISSLAQITSEEHLQPDPQIINTLKRKFKKKSTSDNLLLPLLALFGKRIPAYQILLAAFIAAISYFSIIKRDFSPSNPGEISLVTQPKNQIIQPVEFPILPLEQDQQIGKSLSEDSLSAKFRVSSL